MAADLQHLYDMLFSPIPPIIIVKKEQKTFPEEELDRLTDLGQPCSNLIAFELQLSWGEGGRKGIFW